MNEPRPEMMPEAPVMTEAPVSGQDAGAAPDVLPSAADLPPGDDDEEELPLPPEDSRPEPGAVTWEGDRGCSRIFPGRRDRRRRTSSAAAPVRRRAGLSGRREERRRTTPPEDDEPMTLLGHLGELRRRLTRVVIAVILGFFACYSVAEPMYDWLLIPLKANLPPNGQLTFLSPQGLFFVYMKLALLASVFLTSPFAFYQLWAFIAPGLYREEKRAILPLSLLSALFFLSGAAFCYFMVFPVAFEFFMSFATDVIVPMISVDEYLSFVVKLLLAFGLVFEMPLFSYFLSRMGLLTPQAMRRHRKYAVLAIFIVAAILTPPDVFSQCLMAAPMLVLYEVSVYVSALARKGRSAAKPADAADAAGADGERAEDAGTKREGSEHA